MTANFRFSPGLGSLCTLLAVCAVAMLPASDALAQQKMGERGYRVDPNTGSGLTLEMIDQAINAGTEAVYNNEPNYTVVDARRFSTYQYNYKAIHEMGNQALATWAILTCGESYQNPRLMRRLHWIFSRDASFTYDRGMRLQMLAELPYSRWADWVHRDMVWLEAAMTDQGNFPHSYTGGVSKGYGDNANGQYGVLGLWGAERSGKKVDQDIWMAVDKYWREAQDEKTGGWGIYHPKAEVSANDADATRVSGPMTAGAVAALTLTERYLYGPKMAEGRVGAAEFPHLRRGINWLDTNFSLADPNEEKDWFYYMWSIQRVGHASGYRTFNDIDWFRVVTANVLHRQTAVGDWKGEKGELLSTGFSLLYLANAYRPLAIGKIRSDNFAWDNRPHDIWNFVDYISHQYEYDTTWQIVELNQEVFALIEAPVLFMTTDAKFTLSKPEIDSLRAYIDAGGLLVVNQEKPDANMSVKQLAQDLFPNRELERVPENHPLNDIHQQLGVTMPMDMVQNGIRPLMIVAVRDVGKGLQRNSWSEDGFKALSNIYLYVTGLNPRRPRLQNNYVSLQVAAEEAAIDLEAARIRHAGNYDPEPASLQQLHNILINDHQIKLKTKVASPSELTNEKIAFLTTTGDAALTTGDAASLRQWIEDGGLLWVDAASGSAQAAESANQLVKRIIPEAIPVPLPSENPLISGNGLRGGYDNRRVNWRFYALKTMGPVYTPRLMVVELNGRPAIIVSAEDVTCGLAGFDHWGIFGYSPESARKLVINSCLLAIRNPGPGGGGGGGGDFE